MAGTVPPGSRLDAGAAAREAGRSRGEGKLERSIVLLSLSAIADDPRVRRQGDLLHAHGWRVHGVGLPGARSPAPAWPVTEVAFAIPPPRTGWRRAVAAGPRLLGAQACRILPSLALARYWERPEPPAFLEACARAPGRHVLANDWTALPLAARIAHERGGRFGYDTHEYATEEYAHRASWRLVHQPVVRGVEDRFVREAAFVCAVSPGIADALNRRYALAPPAFVLRNVPRYQAPPERDPGDPVRVLYHGILAPNRGLEALVDSVRAWRPELTLTLRGPGETAYVESLRRRAEGQARIVFAPPVAAVDLVAEAAAFDVGVFALPASSPQNVYALPNKLFEYVMAGLALCVTDLPDMARVVREHDLGVLIQGESAGAIAAALNGLDRERIAQHRRNARAAARVLCWEEEGRRLLEACERLAAGGRGDASGPRFD